MTDEEVADQQPLIEQLRSEMQEQYNTLKAETETLVAAQKAQIEQLEQEKKTLQAALVKSATAPMPEEPPAMTEEEIYRARVEELATKGLDMMERSLTQ